MQRLVCSALTLLACVAASIGPASAAPVTLLNDTFNTENGGAGQGVYSNFANFTVADVDLLAPGYFFQLCQSAGNSTPCVDLEGNGNGSMRTRNAYALGAGTATVQFDLAGDQRNGPNNVVTVSLVSTLGDTLFSETIGLPSNAPFTTVTRTVSIAAPVNAFLGFLSGGPADSYGLLLDNVVLIADAGGTGPGPGPGPGPNPVPEPASLLLLGAGLAGLTASRRRLAVWPAQR